ncbi:hypothetical protein CEXT_454361 [Caerostris extrusa]|uniref:Uncharacterized protein n=1 Tax=Caerostris extrusa TaxID=172846 RepID=A0AAV4MYF3_CAEEX|nr:hypothetical protein CEXT_454361 [Caerostris extrusa]
MSTKWDKKQLQILNNFPVVGHECLLITSEILFFSLFRTSQNGTFTVFLLFPVLRSYVHLQKPPLEQTPPPKTHERFRVQISILHAPAKDPGNFRVRSPPGVALGSRLSAGAQLRDLRSRPRHLSPFRRHILRWRSVPEACLPAHPKS